MRESEAARPRPTPALTPTLDAAWQRYHRFLEQQRELLLAQPWAVDEQERVAAHGLLLQLQASAWNQVIAPHTDCPMLLLHATYSPLLYTWGNPCADFAYRYCLLDGRRRYRLYGTRNSSHALDFQVQAGFIGTADEHRRLASRQFEDLASADDGSFDIILAAQPQPGNWLALDPDSRHNHLMIREIFGDWGVEMPAELHIETLDAGPGVLPLSQHDLVERLERAQLFLTSSLEGTILTRSRTLFHDVPLHEFSNNVLVQGVTAVHPSALYPGARFELEPGEALLIECDIPPAQFWNVQLLDLGRTQTDYSHRQSSLNMRQALLDNDGRLRAVLSLDDPGVPNWLDPTGRPRGAVQFRFFFADRPVLPTMRRVPLGELRRHLPEETPHVTPEMRVRALDERRRAALSRFGS